MSLRCRVDKENARTVRRVKTTGARAMSFCHPHTRRQRDARTRARFDERQAKLISNVMRARRELDKPYCIVAADMSLVNGWICCTSAAQHRRESFKDVIGQQHYTLYESRARANVSARFR